METNKKVTIPLMFELLESTKTIKNLELAGEHAREGFTGPPWTDSDIYKAIESASYALAENHDPALDSLLDELIGKIAAAQQPDGYINSYFQVVEPDAKFTDLALKHELYTAGHMFEAAVAHYQATSKRSFLDVAIKMADHIDSVFGNGKRLGYPGHPEIELALIKLWRITGEERYLDLAWFFLDNRGKGVLIKGKEDSVPFDSSYFQDDMPIRDHDQIKGHAVRALYLLSGVADMINIRDDKGINAMLDRVWDNAVGKRMYITGGMGPGGGIEGFTVDYDLPNISAYQETCASIAMAMWAQRMGLLHGSSKYYDIMEKALYNGALAGVSLDGKKFFYANPLESIGNVERSGWFGCACCPPNISRTIASIGGYLYSSNDKSLYINMYAANKAEIMIGRSVVPIKVKTDYPWDGEATIELRPDIPIEFELKLRIPEWCDEPNVVIEGDNSDLYVKSDGYISIKRLWTKGDKVKLDMPMKVKKMISHPNVEANKGLIALQRGPMIYCVEEADLGVSLKDISIPEDAKIKAVWESKMLGGIIALDGKADIIGEDGKSNDLYKEMKPERKTSFRAIPYYAWNNRKMCPMKVWLPVSK